MLLQRNGCSRPVFPYTSIWWKARTKISSRRKVTRLLSGMTRDVSSFPVPFLRNGGLSIVLPPRLSFARICSVRNGPRLSRLSSSTGYCRKKAISWRKHPSPGTTVSHAERPLFLPGGNPDLKSEHGFTYDVGLSFSVGKENVYALSGGINWFDSHIDDWIIWLPTTKGFFSPRNLKRYMLTGQRPTPTLI